MRQITRWEIEQGFELSFEPLESSVEIEQTEDGFTVRYLTQDEYCESPSDIYEDPNIFLVHYHRQFWVERKEIIREDDLRDWYLGESIEQTEEYHIFPVSAYIHSGVSLSLGHTSFPFDYGGWDTSHVGAVLVSKKEWPGEEEARKAAEGIVEEWNTFLMGDVWAVVAEKFDHDKESTGDYDTVGGYYGEKFALECLHDV